MFSACFEAYFLLMKWIALGMLDMPSVRRSVQDILEVSKIESILDPY